ncbi:LysR family transcriptional regulator [soil metagenome]
MDLRQLRQFVVLAEELSFRRAAEKLHMSQPPLSVALQRLEESVGVALMDRTRHSVKLTPAGEAFLSEARRLLEQAGHATEIARSVAQGKSGVLRIACVASSALELLPATLRRFRGAYPDVLITLNTETTAGCIAAVRKGLVDIAVIVPAAARMEGLELHGQYRETLSLAVPAEHRLAGRTEAKLSEIADDSIVALYSFADSSGYASALRATFNAAGFVPKVLQDASNFATSLSMVSAGIGVAVIPSPMCKLAIDAVRYLDLWSEAGESRLSYPVAFAVSAERAGPVRDAFIEMLTR